MGIHWSLPQLEALLPPELWARLREAQNDPFAHAQDGDVMKVYNGLDGSVLAALPIEGRIVRVSRRKFRAFLTQGLDVQYGHRLSGITYASDSVTAEFENGREAKGTLIVGCDGPRSMVRDLLLGEEAAKVTPLELVHSNTAVVYGDAEKAKFVRGAHPIFSMTCHPQAFCFISIQDVPDPNKPETWRFQIVTSWTGMRDPGMDNAARLAQVKEKANALCEPFRSANLWMPDDTTITYDQISYWISKMWDTRNGRCTLAGDAAHPMTPHRGQGMNHAICDVANLLITLKSLRPDLTNLASSINEYSEEVVRRGADEVVGSRKQALMLLDWDQLMNSPMMRHGLGKANIEQNEKEAAAARANARKP
ncbi:MAG: hypothetical protein M1820_002189 [Bogoriella megaspora]|nr:MAG: hypothetical protein M1820_002189 [Bogoriella megaspora]